jgi:hypothetical protein
MNELDLLRQLAARAQEEGDSGIDVVARVIQEIGRQRHRAIDSPLSVVSLSACACALVMLAIVATRPVRSSGDTLAAFPEAAINSTGPEAVLKVFQP